MNDVQIDDEVRMGVIVACLDLTGKICGYGQALL